MKKRFQIPEFSEKNYNFVGYLVATLITISGLFLIYEVVSTDILTFKANWNMFKSPLGNLCWFIGFICAILFWGKMGHWSRTPVVKYYDSNGNHVKTKEDMDVMEQSFAKILLPILGHFVFEPLIYAALIYYPIQCVIALVGTIFPYILSLIILAIIVGAWLFTHKVTVRYRSLLLVVFGVIFTATFAWSGYAIMKSGTFDVSNGTVEEQTNSYDSATEDTTAQEEEDDQFEGVGEEGLFGSLPNGTTNYEGEMSGTPIELTITKKDVELYAIYKNIKNGNTMRLDGESLPAMAGDISFYGNDGSTQWVFYLSGDVNNIGGTAQVGTSELNLQLHKNK